MKVLSESDWLLPRLLPGNVVVLYFDWAAAEQAIPVSACTIDCILLLTARSNLPRFKESLTALFVLSLRQET